MSKKKDSVFKRIGRGFKVLCQKVSTGYSKVANSNYVQNIHEDRDKADPYAFYPVEFQDKKEEVKKDIKETKEESDPFATDFTKIKTDL